MEDTAQHIVSDLIFDLRCRAGIRKEYDLIDEDTKEAINQEWAAIVRKHTGPLEDQIRYQAENYHGPDY